VITAVEGRVVANLEDFVASLYDFRPGDVIQMDILRDGSRSTVNLTLGRQQS
jgi:serine protease Do